MPLCFVPRFNKKTKPYRAMRTNTTHYALQTGLLLCSVAAACAQTLVTFQVDMSAQAGTSFNASGGDRVQLRGNLTALGAWNQGPWLTNSPNATNANLFTATIKFPDTITTQVQYKYVIIPNGDSNLSDWTYGESGIPSATGGNRVFQLAGGAQKLPLDFFSNNSVNTPPGSPVTFQVDMTAQVKVGTFNPGGGDTVQVRGASGVIGEWNAGPVLTNDITASNTNLYSGTFVFYDVSGYTEVYKYVMANGSTGSPTWENVPGADQNGGNRFFSLDYNGVTLAPVYFSDIAPGPAPVNVDVTFQVDMSAQILMGLFDPSQDQVVVRGSFQGWSGNADLCTNNPSASNTNLYSTVIPFFDFPTAVEQFKFVANGPTISGDDWENPTISTLSGNRFFSLGSNATLVLPPVYFSDVGIDDILPTNTLVTFRVSMTNAVGTDGSTFDPSSSTVYLNGVFGTWWSWGSNPLPAQWQLTNNPVGSEVYTLEVPFPAESELVVTYKYGLNGLDNEAASGNNRVRYIRTLGSYVMPLDVFDNQVVEPSFGSLTATTAPSGQVDVSWLAVPGSASRPGPASPPVPGWNIPRPTA